MNYKDEVIRAMSMLTSNRNVIFLGQGVCYPGNLIFHTLEEAKVPMKQRIEMPVFEDVQLGISIGLALEGYIPVSIYPRMDFLIIAMNQLVNHLDKMEEMSQGKFMPKVIVRTMIGSSGPLKSGPQHIQDHTLALSIMLRNLNVVKLDKADIIFKSYQAALANNKSTILIEVGDLY